MRERKAFVAAHSQCCAACRWWEPYNSVVGDCTRTAPVAGLDRISMLGITSPSLTPPSGHIMTRRDHLCGEFTDAKEGKG